MSDIGLTHVALPVRSLAASVAFYAKYANMQAVHRRPGVVWVSDRTRPFALALIETSNQVASHHQSIESGKITIHPKKLEAMKKEARAKIGAD